MGWGDKQLRESDTTSYSNPKVLGSWIISLYKNLLVHHPYLTNVKLQLNTWISNSLLLKCESLPLYHAPPQWKISTFVLKFTCLVTLPIRLSTQWVITMTVTTIGFDTTCWETMEPMGWGNKLSREPDITSYPKP
jgi:hypothetical protein